MAQQTQQTQHMKEARSSSDRRTHRQTERRQSAERRTGVADGLREQMFELGRAARSAAAVLAQAPSAVKRKVLETAAGELRNARAAVLAIPSIRSVQVTLRDHMYSDEISVGVSCGESFSQTFAGQADDPFFLDLRVFDLTGYVIPDGQGRRPVWSGRR